MLEFLNRYEVVHRARFNLRGESIEIFCSDNFSFDYPCYQLNSNICKNVIFKSKTTVNQQAQKMLDLCKLFILNVTRKLYLKIIIL